MPKLLCRCGEVLSFGAVPCPIEWRVISDTKFEQFSGLVDAELLYRATDVMLRCPVCGRLWVFWNGHEEPAEYVPDGVVGRPAKA